MNELGNLEVLEIGILNYKNRVKKFKKKGAKAPPLFLFFLSFYLSRWCETITNLVRDNY